MLHGTPVGVVGCASQKHSLRSHNAFTSRNVDLQACAFTTYLNKEDSLWLMVERACPCLVFFLVPAGQLGHGDERDKWAPVMVQRVHTNALRFYDLRMSYIKPWKVLQVRGRVSWNGPHHGHTS
jgi:hypothetical protein